MFDNESATKQRPAFTIIEVLVVVVVISLLIAMITVVAAHVVRNQKVALTQTIQQNTIIAIEEFATIDPLKARYNASGSGAGNRPTFGPYPPYPLFGEVADSVNGVLEPASRRPATLERRLNSDLFGSSATGDEVDVDDRPGARADHDMRSLYSYLKVKVPDGLARIPDAYLKSMTNDPQTKDLIDPEGAGNGSPNAFSILGIHDAWGVPMDYFMYVKLEASVDKRGVRFWQVVDRRPVLRSLGISRDEYDTMRKTPGIELDDSKWIFSEPFPSPNAGGGANTFWADGLLGNPNSAKNGWARAIPAGDAMRGGDMVFGFLPDPDRDK